MKLYAILPIILMIFAGSAAGQSSTNLKGFGISGGGGGPTSIVAGSDGAADIPDPRDLDDDGIYNEASDQVTCSSGTCTFESSSGQIWRYNSTTSEWKCTTCEQLIVPTISRNIAGSAA